MPVVAYTRLRMLWGALDWQAGADTPYSPVQTASGGSDAVTGIGVRRVQVVISRIGVRAGSDPAVMHFDVLNITGGNPDDTWTTGDYTTLETALDTFFTGRAQKMSPAYRVIEYRWYQIGPGVVKPNPAERVTTKSIVGTSGGTDAPPQIACSLTFRTAVRASWGRTYFPMGVISGTDMTGGGELTSTAVDGFANALNTFVGTLATNDFYLVVYSAHRSAALTVEKVEVDSNLDVIRRRRWKQSSYKKILPP